MFDQSIEIMVGKTKLNGQLQFVIVDCKRCSSIVLAKFDSIGSHRCNWHSDYRCFLLDVSKDYQFKSTNEIWRNNKSDNLIMISHLATGATFLSTFWFSRLFLRVSVIVVGTQIRSLVCIQSTEILILRKNNGGWWGLNQVWRQLACSTPKLSWK